MFEVEKVVLRKLGFRAAYAVLQVGQRFGPCERKHWKWLAGEVPKDNLTHRKAMFLLEAAEPLKTVAVFLVIEQRPHASVCGDLVQRALLQAPKVAVGLG
jgi:hypothetical protein